VLNLIKCTFAAGIVSA